MTSWLEHRPVSRPPPPGSGRLAAIRDVAIIAVCVAILAFAFLAVWGAPPAPAARPASPAPARVAL